MKAIQIQQLESLEQLDILIRNKEVIRVKVKYILHLYNAEDSPSEEAIFNSHERGLIFVIMPHPNNSSVIRSYTSARKDIRLENGNLCFYEDKTSIRNFHHGDCDYQNLMCSLIKAGLVQ